MPFHFMSRVAISCIKDVTWKLWMSYLSSFVIYTSSSDCVRHCLVRKHGTWYILVTLATKGHSTYYRISYYGGVLFITYAHRKVESWHVNGVWQFLGIPRVTTEGPPRKLKQGYGETFLCLDQRRRDLILKDHWIWFMFTTKVELQ